MMNQAKEEDNDFWHVEYPGYFKKKQVAIALKHLRVDIAILTEIKKGKGSESCGMYISSGVPKIEPSRECQLSYTED